MQRIHYNQSAFPVPLYLKEGSYLSTCLRIKKTLHVKGKICIFWFWDVPLERFNAEKQTEMVLFIYWFNVKREQQHPWVRFKWFIRFHQLYVWSKLGWEDTHTEKKKNSNQLCFLRDHFKRNFRRPASSPNKGQQTQPGWGAGTKHLFPFRMQNRSLKAFVTGK